MNIAFPGKNVVVAGGSRGIGRAIALGFAAAGANVSICARGAEGLRETERELKAHGGKAHSAPCDLADGAAVTRYVGEAGAALGGIDVLVNTAGLALGRDALLRQLDEPPAAVLCTLTVDDHTSKSGERRYMLGHSPITLADGSPITDARGRRSYVTSAGASPSIGKHLLFAYLPPEYAVEGNHLFVRYFDEPYSVTVAVVGSRPLFDPENLRVRGLADVAVG